MSKSTVPINDPYPVPPIATALVVKPSSSAKVGVNLRTKTNHAVIIKSLAPNSLLQGTAVQEGSEILAINGEAVYSAQQVSDIIASCSRLEFTTIKPAHATKRSPFCYVEVAPTSRINPGVSFDGCCDRSLVKISQVYVSKLEHTRLRIGDIVVAINGVPVWKPEDADREQLKAARAAQALVLYCIDMDSLRDSIVAKAQRIMKFGTVTRTSEVAKRGRGWYEIKEGSCTAVAKVDDKTQLLDDKTGWERRMKYEGLTGFVKKFSYDRVCRVTIESMNELLQRQLNQLKIKIVGEAWSYAVKMGEDEHDASVAAYVIPSAPVALEEMGSPETSNVPVATAFLVNDTSDFEA